MRRQIFRPVVVDQNDQLYREGGTAIDGQIQGIRLIEDPEHPGIYAIVNL